MCHAELEEDDGYFIAPRVRLVRHTTEQTWRCYSDPALMENVQKLVLGYER